MRTTALVWRMRPPVPSEMAGWYLPVVAAGMLQKQVGQAARQFSTRVRMPVFWMSSVSLLSCVFMLFLLFCCFVLWLFCEEKCNGECGGE